MANRESLGKSVIALVLLAMVIAGAEAQSPLPPSVQADVLNNQIVASLKAGDTKAVLHELDEYHKLEAQGVSVPLPLLYQEAIISKAAGNSLRSYDALQIYLSRADKTERRYSDAVRLYAELSATKVVQDAIQQRSQADRQSITVPVSPQGDNNASGKGIWIRDARTQCAVFDPVPSPNESVTWDGQCLQGHASGEGTLTWYSNGKMSTVNAGHMIDGKMNGHIMTRFAAGGSFDGDVENYQWMHGIQRYASGDGSYEGDFKDYKRDGQGIERQSDGTIYNGQWKDGDIIGRGIMTYSNGDAYTGDFEHGRPNGRGVYRFSNGNIWDGGMREGKKDGNGTFRFNNGNTFHGEYRADWPINGTLVNEDGQTCKAIVTKLADGSPYLKCSFLSSLF